MLLVSTSRLVPGMTTATAVQHPGNYQTRLVERGVELNTQLIARMRELGVDSAWISHPLTKDLDDLVISRIPEQRRKIYESIKDGFNDLQTRVITTDDYKKFCGVIAMLMNELIGRDAKAGDMAERMFKDGDELSNHSSNVAYLSMTAAMHIESYIIRERQAVDVHIAKDITSLGVGAMLHDIGKLQSTKELRSQHQFSSDYMEGYEEHAVDGFQALRHRINPLASTIALHHHQRWDGNGWPEMSQLTQGRIQGGLSGSKIHIFARIVAVANAIDNLMCPSDGPQKPVIYALHKLNQKEMASWFDPIVLDAFLRYIPPFASGVQVVLNNGSLAAVTTMNTGNPCKPCIRLLTDDSENAVDIDLSKQSELFIEECQGLSVGKWLYELPDRMEIENRVNKQADAPVVIHDAK